MASPFRYFRKNAKIMLAFFVVLLMLSWVVGDSLMNILTGRSSYSGEPSDKQLDPRATAVAWDGDRLTNQQVAELTRRRQMVNAFLGQIELLGGQSAVEAGVDPSQLRVQRLIGPEKLQEGVEDNVVQTRLLADAARQAGMHVSDEMIRQYLNELGRGNVSPQQMRELVTNMGRRMPGATLDNIFAGIREEMLARNYLLSSNYALITVTPEQRWNDWRRVNERVVVEAAAIPVESLLVDVQDPTEAEIQKFYDDHKGNEVGPDLEVGRKYHVELPSAEPGFRIPRKLDLSYIEANFDSFLAKAEEKVTDEEIAKFYEDNKDPMFIKADTSLIDDVGSKADDAKPEGDASAEKPGDAAAAPADDKPTSDEKKGAEEESKKSSRDNRAAKSVFRLAAFEQDAGKDDSAKADLPKTDAAATPEAKPAGETPAAPGADASASPKKPLEFQPLEEVKDQVRTAVARSKVAEELDKAIKEIYKQLSDDYRKYLRAKLAAEVEKKDAPPIPESLKNLAPLAEKFGFQSGDTGLVDVLQLRETPVGKAGDLDSGAALWLTLFGTRNYDLDQPISAKDVLGNQYVAMLRRVEPAHTPPLADVRDEVIKAWKMQKAAVRAQKRAEELAKQAEEAKQPLSEFFADKPEIKVTRTDPFAELTGGDIGIVNGRFQQQPYRLSQPEGLIAPGPAFMKKVFNLKDGQTAAALNNDDTIAYVIRVVEHEPSLTELRTAYLQDAGSWPGLYNFTTNRAQEILSDVYGDLKKSVNLEWLRKPDQAEQRDSEDAG